MFAMNLDDVKISVNGTPGVDTTAPTAATPTGTSAAPGQPLNISVVVSDATGIASVVGKYQIAGQTTWTDITMTASKVTGTYTGTVPAEATATTGKIKFAMTDTVVPANAGESAEYNIAWSLPGLIGEGESFEGTFPPADWAIANIDGAGKTWEPFTATSTIPAHTGTKVALHNFGASGYAEEGLLITPCLAITASATENNLKFWDSDKWPSDYLYHGVMVSTTDNLPGSFTELAAIPVATEAPAWGEHTIDLAAYKGQNIYLAFKYTGTFADGWYVDDAKVTGATIVVPPDPNPPVAGTPTGTNAAVGSAMTVQTIVTDATGIASVVGHYKLAGQSTWTDFTMTASKAVTGTYTGTIPAQAAPITGKVKFTTTDTVTPANTGDSPEFDIAWANEPDTKWMEWGETYDTGSGVGLAANPWWGGVDFDFGTKADWRLTKVKLGVSTAVSVPWKVRSVSQSSATTIALGNEIIAGTINCDGVSDIVPTVMDVTDTTKVLTGQVAIVFDMPAASYITLDQGATSAHTYVETADNGTLSTLTSLAAQFTGAWLAGIYVSKLPVGIEGVEMLPGKSELSQNYPNPFNPTTSIKFYNNMTGNVKLTVLNAKGETVTTLINNNVVAGSHKVNFDGARFNSGVYFYKLETPTATITKKMLLVK